MKLTKQQQLDRLLRELAALTGQAASKEHAINLHKDRHLFIEYASSYGGYRLVNVGVTNGAHYGAFGGNGCEGRIPFKQMELKLHSLIQGAAMAHLYEASK